MKQFLTFTFIFILFSSCLSQMTAKVQLKEPIEGICDNDNIYSLMDFQEGQIEAEPNLSEGQIEKELNNSIKFLDKYPKYKGKGIVSIFINCKGESLKVTSQVLKKRNTELENELIEYFKLITKWKPGTYYKKTVDSDRTYSFKIKKGLLTLS